MFDFVYKYGNITFAEKKFTEIDAVILSCLLYLDLDDVVSSKKKPLRLEDAFTKFCTKENEKYYNKRISATRKTFEMANLIKSYKRYKNILLYRYIYKFDSNEQFSAMCMKLDDGTLFIGFEGTDERMSGWKEDMALTYQFPVPAQKDAIRYLNSSVSLSDKKIILGGHSKGGHLSLIAGMFAFPLIKRRIVAVYNFDGPGLRKQLLASRKYKKISSCYHHIIPNESIVGLLLRNSGDYMVIHSKTVSFWAHSPYTWDVIDDEFRRGNLVKFSKRLKKNIDSWLDHHNDQERKMMTEGIFSIFEKCSIEKYNDIVKFKNFISLVKSTRLLDEETKELTVDFVKNLWKKEE